MPIVRLLLRAASLSVSAITSRSRVWKKVSYFPYHTISNSLPNNGDIFQLPVIVEHQALSKFERYICEYFKLLIIKKIENFNLLNLIKTKFFLLNVKHYISITWTPYSLLHNDFFLSKRWDLLIHIYYWSVYVAKCTGQHLIYDHKKNLWRSFHQFPFC